MVRSKNLNISVNSFVESSIWTVFYSWYTAGMFLETRKDNMGLDKFFTWIEER
jgi:hypothetical protein